MTEGGTIGDRVWLDADGDGIQDVGETGLSGVGVDLYLDDDGTPGPSLGDTLVSSTTTDANGNYLFVHLPPGTYYTDVTTGVPTGLVTSPGTTDPSATRTVTAEEVFRDLDFGYTNGDPGTAIIGDYLWNDSDSDGIQDAGEVGIGGVTVNLVDPSDGSIVATTMTAADGSYLFVGVTPGQYRVEVATGGPLASATPTVGPQSEGSFVSNPVSVLGGDVLVDVDFGFNRPGTFTITDSVWLDEDSDGVFDAGENGIEGVTVNLVDSGGNIIGTAVSAPDGTFTFSGVPNGDYTIQISDTSGELNGFSGTTVPADNRSLNVTVAGANVTGINFGYIEPGEIGDRIWSDADGDGVQDPGELGIGGVTVELYQPGPDSMFGTGDDVLVATTTTAPDGTYVFDGLPPGDYQVRVDTASASLTGYTNTGDPDGGTDSISTLNLNLGESDRNQDFGYQNLALFDISGTVFEDLDEDGLEEAGEGGFQGVTLDLIDDMGNVIATAITDANGDYTFPDVPDGNYTVSVTDAAGILDNYRLTSGLDTLPVTMAGAPVTDVDFGYVRNPDTASIGDTVFFDANRDGIQNGSESGIGGVNVELFNAGPDGVIGGGDDFSVGTTVTTLPDGLYEFDGLPPGNYYVQVSDSTSGVGNGGTELANLARTDTMGVGDNSSLIVLSEGQIYQDADFGYAPAAGQEALGDTVFFDSDPDGAGPLTPDGFQQPGELGIPGVLVEVYLPGPDGMFDTPDDVLVGSDTTDPTGTWLVLVDVPPGPGVTYDVRVDPSTLPAGLDTDQTSFSRVGSEQEFLVQDGEDVMFADFGFTESTPTFANIGDRVYVDTDGDGVQNGIDFGAEDVTLALVDLGPDDMFGTADDVVIATTITDENGDYLFTGVDPAGDYQVVVTDNNHILDALNPTQSDGGVANTNLTAGGTYVLADFGYAPSGGNGVIGNQIWRDVTGGTAGVFDPATDQPLAGVSVDLWLDTNGNGVIDAGVDNFLRRTTTDSNGEYEFLGLEPEDYIVEISDVGGVLTGYVPAAFTGAPGDGTSKSDPDDNGVLDVYATTLTAGSPVDFTADFGFEPAPGMNYTLSGITYFDENDDGDFNNIDSGQGGVVVDVFLDTNGDGVGDSLVGSTFSCPNTEPSVDCTGIPNGGYEFTDLVPGDYVVVVNTTGTFLQDATQTEPATNPTTPANTRSATIVNADVTDVDFGFSKPPNWVLITDLRTYVENGRVVIEMTSGAQIGTAGFTLWRHDAESGSYVQVNRDLLAALPAPQGATYRLVDEGAAAGENTYMVYEAEVRGGEKVYGPFSVTTEDQEGPSMRHALVRSEPRLPSERTQERYRAAAEEARMVSVSSAAGVGGPQPIQLQTSKESVHYVGAGEIALGMGVDVSFVERWIQNGRLRIQSGERSVAWLPAAGGSGLFVVGREPETIYGSFSGLRVRRGTGQVMAEVDGGAPAPSSGGSFLAQLPIEEQVFSATAFSLDPEADFWYWRMLNAGHPTQGATSLDVTVPGAVGSAASLRVVLYGATEISDGDDHRVVVSLNGTELGTVSWDGQGRQEFDLAVPTSLLVAGTNTVEFEAELPAGVPYSVVYVDRLEVNYERRYEAVGDELFLRAPDSSAITVEGFSSSAIEVLELGNGFSPKRVVNTTIDTDNGHRVSFLPRAGARYAVFESSTRPAPVVASWSDWQLPQVGAEYVVVTPRSMETSAQRLADFRASDGLSTLVVVLEDLFAAYGEGTPTPRAVRTFFARAWDDWTIKPRYGVLVGKGSMDYRDYWGLGGNHLPPLLTGTTSGLFAADNAFGDAVPGDNGAPEIAIGRIPALTSAELDIYIDKVIAYEQVGAAPGATASCCCRTTTTMRGPTECLRLLWVL